MTAPPVPAPAGGPPTERHTMSFPDITAAFSRLIGAFRCQFARDRFTISVLRAITRAEGRPVRFGITLTLDTDRAAEVAIADLTDPDTAHADVAALLRRVADHFDPAVPGGAQGDADEVEETDHENQEGTR